jgi:hypothetical protein
VHYAEGEYLLWFDQYKKPNRNNSSVNTWSRKRPQRLLSLL